MNINYVSFALVLLFVVFSDDGDNKRLLKMNIFAVFLVVMLIVIGFFGADRLIDYIFLQGQGYPGRIFSTIAGALVGLLIRNLLSLWKA